MPKRKKELRMCSRYLNILCAIICLTGCADSKIIPQSTNQTDNVVQICVGNVVGNGVLWEKTEERLIVVTTGHLFEMGNGEAEVTFSDGLTVAVTSYEITNPDLAFVELEGKQISAELLNRYQAVTEEIREAKLEESLQSDEEVLLEAFGVGGEQQLLEGTVLYPWIYIEDFEAHMILADLDVEQGMSGGGLFDCEGRFQGILCGVSEDGEAAVIPRSVIQAAYATISQNF